MSGLTVLLASSVAPLAACLTARPAFLKRTDRQGWMRYVPAVSMPAAGGFGVAGRPLFLKTPL